jgi:predicted nuclease with TOPRIM domain
MVFKGFKQVVEQSSGLTFENGYIYFVRTNDAKTEGYIYFNGKKYGNVSELRTELEAKITENSKIVSAALNDLQVQIDNINNAQIEGLEEINKTIAGLQGRVDVVESGVTELQGRVDVVESGVTELQGRVDVVESGVTELEGRVGTVESGLTELEGRVDVVESGLTELEGRVDVVESGLTELEGRVDAVESGLTELEQTVSNNKVTNFEYVTSGDSKDLVITLGDGTKYTVDAKNFIKDGMLDSANLSEESGVTYLILTFNTESGKEDIKLDVSTLIDVYTGDNKTIKVENNEISAIVDQADGLVSYNSFETLFTIGGDDVE